ncbi:MAG: hypothetical protein A4E65_02308 [Syntrophorhabdus sp. PtaU1.Bin153]|nr:MAG: hypothetical protein A4E65_02308 [Syntrophorhabdus sp. PtaU1.Bin153]
MNKLSKGFFMLHLLLITALVGAFIAPASAQTVSQFRNYIATDRIYDYDATNGWVGSYYMALPTLSANDTLVGNATTATLTNKTLTSPTVTGGTFTGAGATAIGGYLKTVTNDTDGKILTVAESGTVQTNAGASGAAAWTLPAAAAGLEYFFVVMVAQELRVTPATGDVINIAGVAGDAAEYWTANAIGEALHLVAVDATNWIAISYTGTWTQQTP